MKDQTAQLLSSNVKLFRQSASRYAVTGVLVALVAIIAGTLLVAVFENGRIDMTGIIKAQKNNAALWLLDLMPFVFAFWGQYVSSIMAYQASAMVLDETNELRVHATEIANKANHDVTHDVLTDLPNRVLMLDRLAQAINSAHRKGSKLAVLTMDLDRFKEINDTLGHHQGDRILRQFANRLLGVMQDTDTIARIGGDEFVALLPDIESADSAFRVAKSVAAATRTPFNLEQLKLDVQASIGIAIFPDHGPDPDTLLQRSEMAMYVAKQDKTGYKLYDEKLDTRSPRRLTLMGELRQALDAGDLILHYQPKVRLQDGAVNEVEALVRWPHPRHNMIFPEEFVPLAERTGLIKPLTSWVIKQAITQIREWGSAGVNIGIAVNVSASDLLDSELVDRIAGLLASNGIASEKLVIEITETSIMVNEERVTQVLKQLANMGVRISIDDFGTGYSSLSHLIGLPVQEIKIDRSFVVDMLANSKHLMIVRAIIDLAHNLDMEVIAEGVPDEATIIKLKELGCNSIQGFYVCSPVDSDALKTWKEKFSLKIPQPAEAVPV